MYSLASPRALLRTHANFRVRSSSKVGEHDIVYTTIIPIIGLQAIGPRMCGQSAVEHNWTGAASLNLTLASDNLWAGRQRYLSLFLKILYADKHNQS
jgi:hypothetical protein